MPEAIICLSEQLVEGGKGIRYTVRNVRGEETPAFAIRYDGQVFSYLNRCAHQPMEMDWREGEFFEKSGLTIMCATHGAEYEPHSGMCIAGPCRGSKLHALQVIEQQGKVHWVPQPHWTFLKTETSLKEA